MSHDSQLLDMVVEWEERRAAGRAVSAEELCRDCPELLKELKERLAAMCGMDAVLDVPAPSDEAATPTQLRTEPADPSCPARQQSWPVIPQYEILEELGRGGMGVVFKARQVALGRLVTLKTILTHGSIGEEQRLRFLQEAQAMALLQHPNIVQIHEIGQHGDCPFLVMEYVEGESLAQRLGGKPMPARKAAELVAALARAVHSAHQQGIVHRDLKPSNILLSANGTPKICDFGLAKHLANPVAMTQTCQAMGTPSYMAPEQISGARGTQGPSIDVYALGAVLYEALTGRPPFLADNPLDTIQLVMRRQPVPPRQWQPKTPRDLETICLKCLAKEPHRRYRSALELAEDLTRFLEHRPIHARPAGVVERGWRWCRAHPSLAALMAVVAAAIVVVLAVVLADSYRLTQELERTAAVHRQVLATQDQLQRALAQALADHLDGDLREVASVPLTIATVLEHRPDCDQQQLERALKDLLGRKPLIYGLCVAFERHAWSNDREDFALYVFRRPDGLAVTQLLPPSYLPHYRQWDWYRAAQHNRQGAWTEPYVDASPDRTPMVTFAAPIYRNGRFVGVVGADLAMDYLRNLRSSMDRLNLAPRSYGLVVSAGHRILAHPEDRYEFPSPESDLTKIPADESFRKLASQWGQASAGSARAVDFWTGRPARFVFSLVPATGWTLVLVVD